MVGIATHWREVIAKVKQAHPHVAPTSYKFKHLIATEVEASKLPWTCVDQIAHFLGIKLFPRPPGIPQTWPGTLCKSFLAQTYTNPQDPCEWLVVLHPDALGRNPYIIHCTAEGFADARWFYEVIPELANIVKDPTIGKLFSMRFNESVNQLFASKNNGRGMTAGQIHAFNLFFKKYVPQLEGVCSSCFSVRLPRSGAGERWLHEAQGGGDKFEIRLSAAKPMGLPGQTVEYVSQTIIDRNQKNRYALWDVKVNGMQYTDNMNQEATHIPWTIYDYQKFNLDMPICLCKTRFLNENRQLNQYC